MVWSIATSSGITTITPDGTSDADLSVLLDSAITGGQSGISSPAAGVYVVSNDFIFAADPNGASGTKWLYCSGMTLHHSGVFLRNLNSRLKFTNRNSAGAVVGRFNHIVYRNPTDYPSTAAIIRVASGSGATTIQADSWDLTWKSPNGAYPIGAVGFGGGIGTRQSGIISGCTFIFQNTSTNSWTDHGWAIDAGTVYSNNFFKGLGYIELSNDCPVFLNNTIEDINLFYGSELSASYLEGISSPDFTIYSDYPGYLQDCDITATRFQRISLGVSSAIVFRNSIEFLGTSSEGSGLFVVRLSDNSQVYKRTCNSSGDVIGGNEKGLTTSSASSERLLIDVATKTYDGAATGNSFTNGVFTADYRGIWEAVFVKYGRLPQTFSFDLQGTLATKQSTPFGSLVDSYITVSNSATVAGYTQFTIDHTSSTVSISGSNTQRQFHDYSALEKASFADSGVTTGGNAVPKCCLPNLSTRIYERSTGLCLYNLVIADSSSVPTGSDVIVMAPGKNITLSTGGDYSTTPITTSSTSTITVTDDSDLRTWTGNGATISAASGPNKLVTVGNLSDWVQGSNVILQIPQASVLAANFAGGVRVQVSHRQIFTIPSTAINTTTDVITLGSDSNGDVANFRTTSPNTLIRFTLASGATIPTSSPQIFDGGLYYWKSGGQLSITEGGTAINFTTQGSGSFILIAETEKDNSVVVGGSGYSYALTASNNALIRVKARYWQNLSSCTASEFFDSIYGWSSTAGVSIPDTINASALPDTIHNQIISITTIQLPVSGIQTPTNDGSTVSGLSFALEGTGKIQINANDSDGILLIQDIYAWGVYITSTAAGIRLASADTFTASDLFNYTIKNLELDNTGSIPLKIIGGRLTSSDGSTPIASSTSASIFPNVELIGTGAIVETNNPDITTIKKLLKNDHKIDNITKTLTIYDDNGSTPLVVYDLKDKDGNPATTQVYERRKQ